MTTLIYHGHSCWEICSEEGRILIDPFLSGNSLSPTGPDDFDQLDAIVLTHGHGDHIGDTERIVKQTGALVVCNFEISNYLAARGLKTHPMQIGGGRRFPFGHVRLTIAHHGSSGPRGEYLGAPAGVVVTTGGKRIYHAGDTGLFYDMKLIGEMYGPFDAALFPIGDNFTMGIDDAVKAVEFVAPLLAAPMHYNTFPPIAADPDDFARKVMAIGFNAKVFAYGEGWELP
ncbi:MAG: metal-dependent hydrolase [Nitrospinae bacterium]|nr:metal-dependent hydrolase [Nitrospinota bacterium]